MTLSIVTGLGIYVVERFRARDLYRYKKNYYNKLYRSHCLITGLTAFLVTLYVTYWLSL